jgi:outer membrane protein TolC
MNAHIRSICHLALAVALTSSCFAGDALSESWELLKRENADLASQQKVIESEQAQLQNAEDRRLPTVNLTSQYNVMDDDIVLSMDLSAYGLGSLDYDVQDQAYWDTELTVTLPIYTGGQITAGIESEQADIAENTAKQQQMEDQLFTTFVRRYLAVELAQQNLATRKLAYDNLQKHLDSAIRREQEGTIAHTQRLQSEVERDKAKRQWQQAADDYELALSAYQAMFKSEVLTPSQQLVYVEIPLPDKSQIADMVLSHSPILAQITAKQDKAQAGVKASTGSMKPTVALFGLMELAKDDLTALEPEWVVGARLNWKLYGGGNRSASRLGYQSLVESADLKAQQVQRDLSLYATQSLLSIESAKNNFLSLQSSKELADENLRLQQKAFLQGVNTALDEIDAHLIVTGIQLESHKALYDYYTALADLAALTGEIDRFLNFMKNMPDSDTKASL